MAENMLNLKQKSENKYCYILKIFVDEIIIFLLSPISTSLRKIDFNLINIIIESKLVIGDISIYEIRYMPKMKMIINRYIKLKIIKIVK